MCASTHRGKKRASDCTILTLQVLVSCPTWEPGSKLGSSARADSSPTPFHLISFLSFKLVCVYTCACACTMVHV